MTHLDEGAIVTLRDGETGLETRSHVASCDACGDALREAERRSAVIERALAALDGTAPDPSVGLEAARAEIRRRIDLRAGRDLGGRAGGWPNHLGRAAAVLLVFAGAVSALPGSPLRRWIEGETAATQHAAPAGSPVAQESELAAVTATIADEGIVVVVDGAGPAGPVEVSWIDEDEARVEAGAGSRFSYGAGRIEATVAPGRVRVSLPRSDAVPVRLEVDGTLYLLRSGGDLETPGPVSERTADRILFSPTTP